MTDKEFEINLVADITYAATLELIKSDAPRETPVPLMDGMTLDEVIKNAGFTATEIKAIQSGAWD